MAWYNQSKLDSKGFVCGWCGNKVASDRGYYDQVAADKIYTCPHCDNPIFFNAGGQYPGAAYGEAVKRLPEDVGQIYEELRELHTVSAWTSIVLLGRKLLMHVAISKGAAENQRFIQYVEYLCEEYVARNNRGWIDRVRTIGNTATHELQIMTKEDAELITDFSAMILKLVYEFGPPEAT